MSPINCSNFIDGMDGQAQQLVIIISIQFICSNFSNCFELKKMQIYCEFPG